MNIEWDFQELYDFADRLVDVARFEKACKAITTGLAKELHEMLFNTTPVKTGQLAAGWGGATNYAYTIEREKNGFSITLKNEVEYARAVNDGHHSHNQFNKGGTPYVVNDAHRTVVYTQGNNAKTFVYGHFFVEKSILELENSYQLEQVLYKELEKWFRWCVNGK